MTQFAEQLKNIASAAIRYPVLNDTGLDGAWDFTLTFHPLPPCGGGFGSRGGPPAGGAPGPSDPTGAVSIFDALDKQLGVKLELHKRPEPVLVIDHIEEKPTEN